VPVTWTTRNGEDRFGAEENPLSEPQGTEAATASLIWWTEEPAGDLRSVVSSLEDAFLPKNFATVMRGMSETIALLGLARLIGARATAVTDLWPAFLKRGFGVERLTRSSGKPAGDEVGRRRCNWRPGR
jgi:hypothetical protein